MQFLTDENGAKALSFLQSKKTGVLSWLAGDRPHASTIYYVADSNFRIHFTTLRSTRKYEALTENPKVAFTVSDEDEPRTVQLEGDVAISDTEDTHLKELMAVLKSNRTFGPPLARLDVAAPAFFTVTPRWIRFGDYASGEHGSSNVLHEITLSR